MCNTTHDAHVLQAAALFCVDIFPWCSHQSLRSVYRTAHAVTAPGGNSQFCQRLESTKRRCEHWFRARFPRCVPAKRQLYSIQCSAAAAAARWAGGFVSCVKSRNLKPDLSFPALPSLLL
jgi:hypothetical protein